jgi:N-carbamoylputrescine amidase
MPALALGGADLVLIPQAGTVGEWPEGLFRAEMRTAAFQNRYFVGLCNRMGTDGTLAFAGDSFVCTPEGTVLARAPQGAEHILIADIDLNATGRSHARRLLFQHQRPEIYGNWFGPPYGPAALEL